MSSPSGGCRPHEPQATSANGKSTDRRQRLNERLRAEWIAGAEEEWWRQNGRPMTSEELERVLRRYPGDV